MGRRGGCALVVVQRRVNGAHKQAMDAGMKLSQADQDKSFGGLCDQLGAIDFR